MSRLDYLTIGIVAVCIAALIYLVYRYVNLPHEADTPKSTTEKPYVDTTQTAANDTAGYPAEDNTTNLPEEGAVVENNQPVEPAVVEEVKPTPAPIKPQVTPSKGEAATAEVENNTPLASSTGKYMVIAGSFEQTSSAQKQLKRVQKMGYSSARVEKFNRGAYATVLVNRFSSASEAKTLVSALKSKGIDAMVLEKR
ncbi:SPOR domain-containing protein [Haliscomenobacter hydrossis]|uniref:Sporulation domain-containing protein n=1 Tax=Haliscomenobacter hydrossis (strain ATCC 27775 / DSM 1100 / LMG 10767 / O) TaxID=760192 RepID=F4L368_HALH1|nr:SPOR domain-containing protein [Haliscomenobacter hydrossis]AEE51702.1 Sporulation domain-containing protein [Haliscomenobacter hydrossis DSM 1100]